MWVKIIWILLSIDAVMFLGLLFVAFTSNSDAAGNGMSAGMAGFAGIILLIAALPVLLSHHPISLFISTLLASLPLLGILAFFISNFFPSRPQQQVTLAAYNFSNTTQRAIAQAIEDNDTQQLQELIKGRDLNVKGSKGLNYLQFAIRLVDSQADEAQIQKSVEILLKGGADPNQSLLEAIYYLSPATLGLFLDGGANPNLKDFNNQPLIFRALSSGKAQNAELLFSKGASPNVLDQEGYSPLMRAALRNLWPTVFYLLEEAKADYAYTAPNGQSLASIISEVNQESMVPSADFLTVREWLEKKGIQLKAAN